MFSIVFSLLFGWREFIVLLVVVVVMVVLVVVGECIGNESGSVKCAAFTSACVCLYRTHSGASRTAPIYSIHGTTQTRPLTPYDQCLPFVKNFRFSFWPIQIHKKSEDDNSDRNSRNRKKQQQQQRQ